MSTGSLGYSEVPTVYKKWKFRMTLYYPYLGTISSNITADLPKLVACLCLFLPSHLEDIMTITRRWV